MAGEDKGKGRGHREGQGLTELSLSLPPRPVLYRIFTVDHKLLPVGRTVIVSIEVPARRGPRHARVRDLGRDKDRETGKETPERQSGRDPKAKKYIEAQRVLEMREDPGRQRGGMLAPRDSFPLQINPWLL